MPHLSVREFQFEDINRIADYWFLSDEAYLKGMGVAIQNLPSREDFSSMLAEQLNQSYETKKAYALMWLLDGQPIGHTNLNPVTFGETAFMHLHLWQSENRQSGVGSQLVKKSLPFYFENFQLKTLFCQPYALNPAPNKTLGKVGFQFVKKYTTTPGPITFEQEVNLWEMTRATFEKIKLTGI